MYVLPSYCIGLLGSVVQVICTVYPESRCNVMAIQCNPEPYTEVNPIVLNGDPSPPHPPQERMYSIGLQTKRLSCQSGPLWFKCCLCHKLSQPQLSNCNMEIIILTLQACCQDHNKIIHEKHFARSHDIQMLSFIVCDRPSFSLQIVYIDDQSLFKHLSTTLPRPDIQCSTQ